MSLQIEHLGGQWLASFEGEQKGFGLLSFNTFGASQGYVSLHQFEDLDRNASAIILQGRTVDVQVSATELRITAKGSNRATPGFVTITARRAADGDLNMWAGDWESTDNFRGTFSMVRASSQRLDDNTVEKIDSWQEFSEWAFQQPTDNAVYRGLGSSLYPLESTAHRAGIFNLDHYLIEMLPRVRAELLKRHGLRINLGSPDGLAEMLALIRHHGFPSPIMDWSKSPWVALYFAITSSMNVRVKSMESSYCRVYCLHHSGISVVADVQQTLLAPSIAGRLIEIPTPMTSRVTAQEGVFLLTPCVDVLTPLTYEQKQSEKVLIRAVDIDLRIVPEAHRRLEQMMINEATMLSSVDSTLNHLKSKLVC
jgi:hypothetical protein